MPTDVTQILRRVDAGDPAAAGQLLPLVYEELRKLAAQRMGGESTGRTLQPTALVHDAYLRLVDVDVPQHWNGRGHFFAAAAEAMRRILVDDARRRNRVKRGGGLKREELDPSHIAAPEASDDLLELDAALGRLAGEDPVAAELVKLRYFAGLKADEAAVALGISPSTADRHWTFARAWLHRTISKARDSA